MHCVKLVERYAVGWRANDRIRYSVTENNAYIGVVVELYHKASRAIFKQHAFGSQSFRFKAYIVSYAHEKQRLCDASRLWCKHGKCLALRNQLLYRIKRLSETDCVVETAITALRGEQDDL